MAGARIARNVLAGLLSSDAAPPACAMGQQSQAELASGPARTTEPLDARPWTSKPSGATPDGPSTGHRSPSTGWSATRQRRERHPHDHCPVQISRVASGAPDWPRQSVFCLSFFGEQGPRRGPQGEDPLLRIRINSKGPEGRNRPLRRARQGACKPKSLHSSSHRAVRRMLSPAKPSPTRALPPARTPPNMLASQACCGLLSPRRDEDQNTCPATAHALPPSAATWPAPAPSGAPPA